MILKEEVKAREILPYGFPEFIDTLRKMGYIITRTSPKTVLVGIKQDFTNDEYAEMIEAIINGAELIGMHQTTIYAKNGRKYPGVGAILEMLRFATNKDYKIIGKPSKKFYKKALKIIGEEDFRNITIISDDIKGDLIGAKKLGMKTVFVLSGKYKKADEIIPTLREDEQPDEILNSIIDYFIKDDEV
jgi:NagD protein